MSAYMCDDYHLSALGVYAAKGPHASVYHEGKTVHLWSAEEVAAILHAENVRSVNYHYHEEESPAFAFDDRAYLTTHAPVQIIKAANCYDYQACETDDYEGTLAKAIISYIISNATRNLPGYEQAEWELSLPSKS